MHITDQAGVLLSEYQYNADGIMVKSSDKSITYDEAGRVVNYTYDNGAYTKFTYSQSEYEHLQSYQHKVIMKDSPYFFYQYDKYGNFCRRVFQDGNNGTVL